MDSNLCRFGFFVYTFEQYCILYTHSMSIHAYSDSVLGLAPWLAGEGNLAPGGRLTHQIPADSCRFIRMLAVKWLIDTCGIAVAIRDVTLIHKVGVKKLV